MKPEHDHANCKCKEGHAQPAADRKEAEESLEILDEKIWEASEVQKASKTLAKELCKKKKELKAHTGVKQQASKKGSRGKARIPTKNDMVDENATPVSDAEPDTLYMSMQGFDSKATLPHYLPTSLTPLSDATKIRHFDYVEYNSPWVAPQSHLPPLDPALNPTFMMPPTLSGSAFTFRSYPM